jgi:hypothetical protein
MDESAMRAEFYRSIRSELISRLGYRDVSIGAYITIIGGYFAYMLGQHFQKTETPTLAQPDLYSLLLMLPIPFICFTFSFVVLQHHIAIGGLSKYVRDLNFLDANVEREYRYEGSREHKLLYQGWFVKLRIYFQAALFVLPMFYPIIFISRFPLGTSERAYLALSASGIFAIAGLHLWAEMIRRSFYARRRPNPSS